MTYAQTVVDLGERLWGARWAMAMSEFCDINLRTLTRIHAAAREGQEYAAARGVVSALRERLSDALEALEAVP